MNRFLLIVAGVLISVLLLTAGIVLLAPYIAIGIVIGALLWLIAQQEDSSDEETRTDPPDQN